MAARRVLLVGWDAADWKVIRPLMDVGKMPAVQRLVETGATGQIATLHPALSPMLWTSIATGKRPFKHGIHGFSEPTPDGRGVQPITNLSRKSKAVWNILGQNHLQSVVVGWWPSHPAEPINGVMVSDHYHSAPGPLDKGWPLPPSTVHPLELAETLAGLRRHPDLLTPQMVEPFIPLAGEIDQDNDGRLALFLRTLAECISINSAAIWLLDNQPWDFFAVYYDAIDHFCHGFMRYHPPRQSWIGQRDFDLYHNVVSMAYQFHDQMLGTLIERAGEDTTVILLSDHGFHPDHLRPRSIPDIPAGPAIEHRQHGVLAISGPGIEPGRVLDGASLLDIAPTILSLYGLPIGEDLDGKVLSRVFVKTPKLAFIPSWEEVSGADGRHPPYTRLDPEVIHLALERMIALGYVERPDENREMAVSRTIRELRYNLGEAYQDADRHLEAHAIFTELHAADPDEQRFAVRLFVSCQALGMHGEMRRVADDLDGRRRALFEEAQSKLGIDAEPESLLSEDERRELGRWRNLARYRQLVTDYLKAQVLMVEERYPEALAAFERLAEADPAQPGLILQTADVYLRLRRWSDAQQVYEKALALDPDNAHAYLGMCRVALQQREFNAAAQSALDALQRSYQHPLAHFLLGVALAGMQDYERAANAFRAAISLNPHFPEAHLRLARLLEKCLGDVESAREHRRLAHHMRTRKTRLSARPSEFEQPAAVSAVSAIPNTPLKAAAAVMPPLTQSLVVVTGLPRSGTSMVMQMLAAGGMEILSDGVRKADEDNPRGYFEFEAVKNLTKDASWLSKAQGKAVKIIVPLLAALPAELACRVILCERDLDAVLDSQERMLARHNQGPAITPQWRWMLKQEYVRTLDRAKAMLAQRSAVQLLLVEHRRAISDILGTAEKVNRFLGGGLDVAKMTAVIDSALYRNRAATPGHIS